MNSSPLLRVAFAFASSATLSAVHADVQMRIEVSVHNEATAGATNVPPDSRNSFDISLSKDVIVVKTRGQTSVYDFARRKRQVIDDASHERVTYSLFDTVGFRTAEARNREIVAKALGAAKIQMPGGTSQVDIEHTLAIQQVPSSPLKTKEESGFEVFLNEDQPMFRRSLEGTLVGKDDARMFAQFVRYVFGGHPQILSKLAESGAIPKHWTLVTRSFMVSTREFDVQSIRTAGVRVAPVIDVPMRKPSAPGLGRIDRVLDRGAALVASDVEAIRLRNESDLQAAVRDGKAVDALLLFMERILMGGAPGIPPEVRQLIMSSEDAKRLSAALSARSKDELAAAIAVFTDLRAGSSKPYMLDLFAANDRKALGEINPSITMFLDVLEANPALAGAYKDLGDALYSTFDAPRAWRAWDTGRAIAPAFANFRAVDGFEENLARTHPEYF